MAKMTQDDLVAQLKAIYAADLACVALYGSAARGEHITRRSDLNVIVVVEQVTMDHLRKESPVARAWRDAGNPPPLTLSRREWAGSADIFPIEYSDILTHHRVLHGALPLDGVRVQLSDLRLQLEHESMSTLLRLRHAVLGAAADSQALLVLMEESASTMLVLLRALLRMLGEQPPTDSDAVCARVTERAALDTEVLRQVLRHRRGSAKLALDQGLALMESYLGCAESLVQFLDAYVEGSTRATE
ncbi:MAG: nucleotidyltransferase domain-containing protein [Gemmatimonadaceae bacterium]